MEKLELLAVVALLADAPQYKLIRGQVGTVVEILDDNTALIEFCDLKGRTHEIAAFERQDLLTLHHAPIEQVAWQTQI